MINNENFIRGWNRSQESQFFNRTVALAFTIGLSIGVYIGYWVYSKKITEQSQTIERQESIIELYELSHK